MTRPVSPSALKRLKETFKSDDVILPPLERHVMRVLSQADPDLSPEFMHPSEMSKSDWCGRHNYYRIIGTPVEKIPKANPSFRMNNAYAEGHTIHGKYQTWLWEMGVLYGNWICITCEHRWAALAPRQCPQCQSPRLEYREMPFTRSRYFVEGHADGAVHDLDGWTGLIEIKSIGVGTLRFEAPRLYNRYQDGETLENVWYKINRPFSSHMKQGQLYLWLAWPHYDEIAFLYESKFSQQTKEFLVKYNPRIIAPVLEIAKEVSQCVRVGMVPDRPIWAEGPDGKVCKSCEYRSTCWQTEVTHEEEDNPTTTIRVRRTTAAKRRRVLSQAGVRPA